MKGSARTALNRLTFQRSLLWGILAGAALGFLVVEWGVTGFLAATALAGVAMVVGLTAQPVWVDTPRAEAVAPEPPDLFDMVEVDGGRFFMGSRFFERGRFADERRHRVTVSDFRIGRMAITRAQYQEVMEIDKAPGPGGPDHPVTRVSWREAVEFCNRASEVAGFELCYAIEDGAVAWRDGNGYRLPTEAEWEYAARAGTRSRWSFGNGEALLGDHAWYSANAQGRSHPVATREPNPWGLYDMHGNVWEWCWDVYGKYPRRAVRDPRGPDGATSALRVVRGGSFSFGPRWLRSANRVRDEPEDRNVNLGFRCVRGPRPQPRPIGL